MRNRLDLDALLAQVEGQTPGDGPYRYGAQLRPIGFATVPQGFTAIEAHPAFRHGVVVYPEALPLEEAKHLSLVWIPQSNDIEQIATEIAADAGYPRETLQQSAEDPQYFAQIVGQEMDARNVYVQGGRDGLLPLVLQKLRQRVEGSGSRSLDLDALLAQVQGRIA